MGFGAPHPRGRAQERTSLLPTLGTKYLPHAAGAPGLPWDRRHQPIFPARGNRKPAFFCPCPRIAWCRWAVTYPTTSAPGPAHPRPVCAGPVISSDVTGPWTTKVSHSPRFRAIQEDHPTLPAMRAHFFTFPHRSPWMVSLILTGGAYPPPPRWPSQRSQGLHTGPGNPQWVVTVIRWGWSCPSPPMVGRCAAGARRDLLGVVAVGLDPMLDWASQ